ncbi:50S ribosome-binding GTPase [Candidatus Pacearchaeota archaeon]|nr:50S ribosome-binding GTPase [Candidatus Pacearchaeota archaeon]
MASTNQSPQYQKAESMFLNAQTSEERLKWLEEMIRECPKHKSSEKMLANLKTRYIKLKEKIESQKKTSRSSGKKGIKKEEMQAVIVGLTNSGKSSLLSILTNAKPQVGENPFITKQPEVGMMNYNNELQIQLIEIPAMDSEHYDKGLVNTAEVIIILVTELKQIEETQKEINKSAGKQIIVFNKIDLIGESEKRKIFSTLQSRKYDFVMISAKENLGIEELKDKIFKSFDKIRVYSKEPGKPKSNNPIILELRSTVEDAAKKLFKKKDIIKEASVTGPSSKFPNQKVSLKHQLKDRDIVEFKIK